MNAKLGVIIPLLLLFVIIKSLGQPNNVKRKIEQIRNNCDSVIIYKKGCSYCVSGMRNEVMIIYKGSRTKMLCFQWSNLDKKAKKIFRHSDLNLLDEIISISRRLCKDSIQDGVKDEVVIDSRESLSSHGPFIKVDMLLGNKSLTVVSWITINQDVEFFLKQHYDYGKLILLLNMAMKESDYFIL